MGDLLGDEPLMRRLLTYAIVWGVDSPAGTSALADGQRLSTWHGAQMVRVARGAGAGGGGARFIPSAAGAAEARQVGADLPAGAAVICIVDAVLLPEIDAAAAAAAGRR